MRLISSLCLAAAAVAASAQTYIDQTFANGIPSTYTIVNADGQPMKEGVYKNLGNNPDAGWVAGSLSGHGRCALSPTRCPDGETQQDNWLILPAFSVASTDAIIRWEARGLHSSLPESYKVMKRVNGGEWTPLVTVDEERYAWTMRSVKLDAAIGESVEIAFVATTRQGFILAVDNIYVGVPQEPLLVFENRTPHYAAPGEIALGGVIYNHGADDGESALDVKVIVYDGADQEAVSVLSCPPVGSCASMEFGTVANLELGGRYTYTISAEFNDYSPAPSVSRGGATTLAEGFVVCSEYPRLQVVDRCSGTWCNNCPMMGISTERLKRIYGDEIVIVEAHINDRLANDDYTATFLGEVRAVPALIPNHRIERISYSTLASTDDYSSRLDTETVASVTAEAQWTSDGNVEVTAEAEFAWATDNAADRYRVGYLLLGDYHDPASRAYRQECSALSFNNDEYYYMPDIIPAELTYFDNVPVNALYAAGVPCSLPANIAAGATVEHQQTLSPGDFSGNALRVLVMLIDTETGAALNAALAEKSDPSEAPLIGADPGESGAIPEYYGLTGRRLGAPAGVCIERCGGNAVKRIFK